MRPRLLALPLGLLLAVSSLSGASAGVQTAEVHEMPRWGDVVIAGHGFGHGHGMSQHGAQGAAAEHGMTWRQIVGFYYPGTEFGVARKKVQVLITADTTRDVAVSPRPGLFVRDRGSKQKWVLPDNGATRWRLDVNRKGRSVLTYLTDRWRLFRRLDGDGFFAARGKPITLHLPSGSRQYRGRLIAARPHAGSTDRDTVNVLSLDNYIKGVVPHEMPVSWHPEAVRSQAVAARTYAAYERAHPRDSHYQICDTTACQVYGGFSAEDPRSNDAVRATRKVILTHGGQPAFTQFSASSGGWTSANQFSYLPAQEDPYDKWKYNSVHSWERTVRVSAIEQAFGVANLKEIRVTGRDGNGDWQGRVLAMEIVGVKGKVVKTTGNTFRLRLGLRSNWFTFPG